LTLEVLELPCDETSVTQILASLCLWAAPGAPVSDIATTTVQPTAKQKALMKMRLADKMVTVKNDSKEEVHVR
jgi:hypothetical protein